MNHDALAQFITKYRFHSCLWDASKKDYTNRHKRLAALEDLAPLLGESATIDSVRKKIDIIRNGFFREHKKVSASIASGDTGDEIYTPKLWYYDLMSFLTPKETTSAKVDVVEQPMIQAFDATLRQLLLKRTKSTETHNEILHYPKKAIVEEKPVMVLKQDNIDRDDIKQENIFGLYLGQQLQQLSSDQRTFAEKLMSDVLFLARTNKLNETSDIITHPSNQEYSNVSMPSSDAHISTAIIENPISQDSAPTQYVKLEIGAAQAICEPTLEDEDLESDSDYNLIKN